MFNGLKLKELRNKNFLSVAELSAKLGVSKQLIYDYESCRVQPANAKIKAMTEILDVPFEALMKGGENYTKPIEETESNIVKNQISVWERLVSNMDTQIKELKADKEFLQNIIKQNLGKSEASEYPSCQFIELIPSFIQGMTA